MNEKSDDEVFAVPGKRKQLSPLRFYGISLVMIFYWPLAALLILVAGWITRPFLDEKKHRDLGQSILGISFGSFMSAIERVGIVRIDDECLKDADRIPGPLIIASNHPALWDALLLIRRFVRVSCIMKMELLANPLLGGGARFAGFLPNAPRMRSVRMAIERLNLGERLLLFPEGTRTRRENGAVNGFRYGLGLLARESGAPVLPVFITTDSRYLEKGWPPWKMPEVPITISIRLGEIVRMGPEEEVRVFTDRLEGVFRRELG